MGYIQEYEPAALVFSPESIDSYSDIQPENLLETEDFSADTGQFTEYTEGSPRTFTIESGVGKIINTSGTYGNNIEVISDSEFKVAHLFISIEIPSHPVQSAGYDNIGVGIVKDANNFAFANFDRVLNETRIQIKIGGTNHFISHTYAYTWNTFPVEIGFGMIGNRGSFWRKTAGVWTRLTEGGMGTYYDFTAEDALDGWKAGFTAATRYSSEWWFDNFKYGYYGGVGIRDFVFVTNKDGTTYIKDNQYVYFSASLPNYDKLAICGFFRMNMADFSYEQIGIIAVQRNGYIRKDLNFHLVIDGSTYRLIGATWGNYADYGVSLLYATVIENPLDEICTVIETFNILTVPGMLTADYGAYDPMLAYDTDSAKWIVLYTLTENFNNFTGNPWYPAIAESSDLSTWNEIEIDIQSLPFQYEGTKLILLNHKLWYFCGGPYSGTTARIYDKDLVYIGNLGITFHGSANGYPPHPAVFTFGMKTYVLTFDSTLFNSTNGTQGQPELYSADRGIWIETGFATIFHRGLKGVNLKDKTGKYGSLKPSIKSFR